MASNLILLEDQAHVNCHGALALFTHQQRVDVQLGDLAKISDQLRDAQNGILYRRQIRGGWPRTPLSSLYERIEEIMALACEAAMGATRKVTSLSTST